MLRTMLRSIAALALVTTFLALGAPAAHAGVPFGFSVADLTVGESAGVGEVVVSISYALAHDTSVTITSTDGTATSPDDYGSGSGVVTVPAGETSTSVPVAIVDDDLDEPDETFDVTLSAPSEGMLVDGDGVVTITDDDDPPEISADAPTIAETDGPTTLDFTLTLDAASGDTVTVDYATNDDGTATAGTDFTAVDGTATFLPGATEATVSVPVTGDAVDEPDETVVLDLTDPTNATLAAATATGTIQDDEDQPGISVGDVTLAEGDTGTTDFTFTVSLSRASSQDVTVDYATAEDTAVASDFTAASGTVTFTAGSTTADVTVPVTGDALFEADEQFVVDLSNPTGGEVADAQATGTITNDDAAPTLSIADVTVEEGDSGSVDADFTVSLSAASGLDASAVVTTTDVTALAGTDYTALTAEPVTIAAGATEATVTVAVLGDTIDEADETFTAALAGPTGATIGDGTATGTITDDDEPTPPALSIADVTVVEGDTGSTNAGFVVTLSAASAQTVTVPITVTNGTTTDADRGTPVIATVTFVAGDTSETLNVPVTGDTKAEANETFTVTLGTPVGATIADGSATGTITDDDGGGTYTPVTPARILDTRSGVGHAGTAKIAPFVSTTLDVTGVGGVPATGVQAVVVNFTVTQPNGPGFFSAYTSSFTGTSNINFVAGENVSNLVVVPVDGNGDIHYAASSGTHVVGDVAGWFAVDASTTPGSHLVNVDPARVLDTRTGQGVAGGGTTPLAGGQTRVLDVTGVGGVPATGVTAVVLNVTSTASTQDNFLSFTPTGGASTSNVNFTAGENAAGLVIVPVGPDGNVRYTTGNGSTHVVADVFGWFATPGTTTGSVLTGVAPARILDTRNGTGGITGKFFAGVAPVTVAGRGGVPASGAGSAILNLTVTEGTQASFLAATPTGAPGTSNLNFAAGQVVANLAFVPLAPNGTIQVRNNAGQTHVVIDVFGWFSTPAT